MMNLMNKKFSSTEFEHTVPAYHNNTNILPIKIQVTYVYSILNNSNIYLSNISMVPES